jgi:lysozyme family protein
MKPLLAALCLALAHGCTMCPAAEPPAAWLGVQEPRWEAAQPTARHRAQVSRIADRILAHRARYESVDSHTNVPWYVIAALHNMESSGSFRHHLHEGSPLSGRTRYIPKGRPTTGTPPFTWEASATDALRYDRMGSVRWSHLTHTLYAAERYNGTGYLRYHPEVPSPYLWSGTTLYTRGKYIADGKWSSTAVSSQIGCAAIWKELQHRKILHFNRLR